MGARMDETRRAALSGLFLLGVPAFNQTRESDHKTSASADHFDLRQVQRYIAELETAGLVKRIQRHARHGGKLTNIYDLGGLVVRLKELEPDFRKVDEDARKARRQVSR